jgi:3-oxoacyl-[acyl-carrier protein] reductase
MEMSMYTTFADSAFADKSVLITGAASGMGLETARAFALKGATVIVADRNADGLARARESLPGDVHAITVDVGSIDGIRAMYEQCDKLPGRIDTVVCCAAIITAKKIPDQDWAHWERVMSVNLMGTFFTVQGAVQRMLADERGGTIVCVASDVAYHGGGGLIADTAYAASKAGTLSIVKSVGRELAGRNVRINALNPGPTDSPMHNHIDPALKERIAANLPMRRMGRPEDMAAAILFLCSPEAEFVYGSAMDVDGGSSFR